MKILHIDSSILGDYSVSRSLTADIIAKLRTLYSDVEITYRDLAEDPAMHLSGRHMAVFKGAPVEDPLLGADLAKGGAFLEEVIAADIIVIGAPMYNFTISSQLKAWIDRIVVAGQSFKYGDDGQPISLLPEGKSVIVASTRGGFYGVGTPAAFLEHHESYLLGILGFIGLTHVTIVRAEGLSTQPNGREQALTAAQRTIGNLMN